MPTLTVLAPDSSLAMDEIARQLGDNAFILSTSKRDGMIEIKATNDPIPPGPRETKARSAFAAALAAHGANEEVMVLQRPREAHEAQENAETAAPTEARPEPERRSATVVRMPQPATEAARAPRAPAFRPSFQPVAPAVPLPASVEALTAHRSTAEVRIPAPPAHAPAEDVVETLSRLHGALSALRESIARTDLAVTATAAAPQPAAPTSQARIVAAGFEASLVSEIVGQTARTAEAAEAGFAEALAGRIIAAAPESMLAHDAVLVLGASGSGRSTLAAKLAAVLRDLHPDRRCRLVEICPRGMTAGEYLRGCARMLNSAQMLDIGFVLWHEEDLASLPPLEAGTTHIIDMPSDGATCARILAGMGGAVPADAPRLLALPAGATTGMIDRQMARPECAGAVVALTKLDECDVAAPELSTLARHDLRIGWLSGTRALVGNLSPATAQVMRDYIAGYIEQA